MLPVPPSGMPIHFLPSGRRNASQAGYQPPYFLPRYSATSVMSTSLSGYRLASSLVDRMTSGPAPVLAATAALGRTSSQPSWSSFTSMPYLAVNFLTLAMYASSSPCTKRFQRSTRSLAPFSGWLFHWAWAELCQSMGTAMALAAAEVVLRNLRRLSLDMVLSPLAGVEGKLKPGTARRRPVQAERRVPLAASNKWARLGSGR